MTSLARKYDQSKLSVRVAILIGLVTFQVADGLLSPEALRTSPLAQSYAVALAVMGLGVLVFALQKLLGYLSEPVPIAEPRTGPVWHEARLFTDPWYQIPAIYCVFVLLCQFVIDLMAKPPASAQAVWFLICVAAMSRGRPHQRQQASQPRKDAPGGFLRGGARPGASRRLGLPRPVVRGPRRGPRRRRNGPVRTGVNRGGPYVRRRDLVAAGAAPDHGVRRGHAAGRPVSPAAKGRHCNGFAADPYYTFWSLLTDRFDI